MDRRDAPALLHLNRALGRVGLLAELFEGATAILFVRAPLATWSAWQGDGPEDPFDPGCTLDVHGFRRRLYELESQLPEEEYLAWGFEVAREHAPAARFLVAWGLLHRRAMREARRFPALRVVRRRTLLETPEETLARLAGGPGADEEERVSRALAALDGARAPRRGPPGKTRRKRDDFLGKLPAASPLPEVLASLGYGP